LLTLDPDRVKTVAFVCIKPKHGKMYPKATAFFVAHQGSATANDKMTLKLQMYVVTAKHVLEGIREETGLDTVFLTYNGPNGKEHTEIPLSNWNLSPDDASEYVDVAVARFNYGNSGASGQKYPDPAYVRCWMDNNLVTISAAERSEIGLGSPVGLAGLFVHHHGASRNTPIVRTGNIAAMPGEPVLTRKGFITVFLIEVRSTGGLSGSPVFADAIGGIGVIGLVHGHFDQRESDPDASVKDIDSSFQQEKINAGIAMVVPADRIREALKPLIALDFYSGR
jgi:hypothetical protein